VDRVLLVLAVLAAAAALGFVWRARNGRFTPVAPAVLAAAERTDGSDAATTAPDDDASADRLTADDLGAALGERATFLQLSSEVCAPCRRTHAVLQTVAAEHPGVSHLDLDVAEHLDLVRRFHVMRTPTVLLLDASGAVVGRMSGATDRRQALAALDTVESCRGGVAPR